MARKGRKPQGEYAGKSAVFSTRITPKLRAALECEAERSKRSLSQEVEWRLRQSIEQAEKLERIWGEPRNRALAQIVSRLARGVEAFTGASWREDAFTFLALKSAIEVVLSQLRPAPPATLPVRIEQMAELESPHSEQLRSPGGVGSAVGLGLWGQVEITDEPPMDHAGNTAYAGEFYAMPQIRRDLGLKKGNDK
jgi:hypothetical protein